MITMRLNLSSIVKLGKLFETKLDFEFRYYSINAIYIFTITIGWSERLYVIDDYCLSRIDLFQCLNLFGQLITITTITNTRAIQITEDFWSQFVKKIGIKNQLAIFTLIIWDKWKRSVKRTYYAELITTYKICAKNVEN